MGLIPYFLEIKFSFLTIRFADGQNTCSTQYAFYVQNPKIKRRLSVKKNCDEEIRESVLFF